MFDLLIRNGLVFDGLGSKPARVDIAVRRGRIVALAGRLSGPAQETVDADGLWVLPGFVDIHTHYDLEVELGPGLSESVRHGVTSVVMGNCSLSLTMGESQTLADIFLRVENIPAVLVRKWLGRSLSGDPRLGGWKDPQGYFRHLRGLALGPNVAPLLGHSALRAHVMGLPRSLSAHATEDEIQRMEDLAVEAFEAGCLGLSVDMVPWHMMSGTYKGRTIPSQHAGFAELRRLAAACRERDLVFQVTPNPQRPVSMLQILWLCVGLFRAPLRATVLTALDSVAVRPLRHFFPASLYVINRLLGGNLRYQTLSEPFTVYSDGPLTPLFEEFPSGVALNDRETGAERASLWASTEFRERFKADWLSTRRRTFHRDLNLMTIVRCPDPKLQGRTIAEIAASRGMEAVDYFMDLLAAHDTDLRWVSTGGNDRAAPRRALLRHPEIHPGFTDAGAHVRNLAFYDGPLALLRDAVRSGWMTPHRAIERCTGEPAEWFRLDAGVLAEGRRADIVLLDPERLREPGPEPEEIFDPLLDGAMRMVKRGNDALVRGVYIGGKLAWAKGEASSALGRERLGQVLTPAPSPSAEERRSRNRIDDRLIDHPFSRYWDVFVLKHQDPRNVALHCLGVALFYVLAAVAARTHNPLWLLALPSSQLIGLLGHALFERSHIDRQDAVLSLRASAALNRMFWRVVTGRYFADIRRLRERLDRYRARKHEILKEEDREPVAA